MRQFAAEGRTGAVYPRYRLQEEIADRCIHFLGLGLGIERVVGSAHIGKLGIATSGRNDAGGQHRVFRRYRLKGRIRMPQPIPEIERAPAIIPR